MADVTKLVAGAQAYDLQHRPPGQHWTRVPDTQVLRLLTGAGIVKPESKIVITCTQHGVRDCPCLTAAAGGSATRSPAGYPGRIRA